MLPYRHTQAGTLMRWGLSLGLLPMALAFYFVPPPPALIHGMFWGILSLNALFTLIFWSLTVEVTPGHFRFFFGPTPFGKRVPIPAIATYEPVDGIFSWGVHYGRRGWLYNVSGRKAVAFTLKDGGRFVVGSDEPEALCRAVAEAALKRTPPHQ